MLKDNQRDSIENHKTVQTVIKTEGSTIVPVVPLL